MKGMGTLVSPLILTSSFILGLGLTAGSADLPRAVGICELLLSPCCSWAQCGTAVGGHHQAMVYFQSLPEPYFGYLLFLLLLSRCLC